MPKSHIVLFAFTALTWVVPPTLAHEVQTRGAATCETWSKQRPHNAKLMESWLLGYLSGLAQESDQDVPKGMDDAALFRWMDDYCRKNPKHSLALGGFMLMGQLRASVPVK